MSFDKTREAIETKIKNEWDANTYPLAHENLPFNPPASAWARESIRPVTSDNADVSGVMERDIGFVWFQIFIPPNKGIAPAFKFADHIKSIFNNKTVTIIGVGKILFRVTEPAYVGIDSDSGNLQYRCLVPYQIDVTP